MPKLTNKSSYGRNEPNYRKASLLKRFKRNLTWVKSGDIHKLWPTLFNKYFNESCEDYDIHELGQLYTLHIDYKYTFVKNSILDTFCDTFLKV